MSFKYLIISTGSVKSGRNSKLVTADVGFNYVRLVWSSDALPKLVPIISDHAFLVDQHVLVCLRSEDDNEIHGMFDSKVVKFSIC